MRPILSAVAICLLLATPAMAQHAAEDRAGNQAQAAQPQGQNASQQRRGGERAERRLPPDATTAHTVELPDRTLRFNATAGALNLVDGAGAVQAEIGFVAYTVPGVAPAQRPVTFAFNGGPGAASAYLHIGVLGPWRLPLEGPVLPPSSPPVLTPNAETWLDFTDLVFIDPVGTGYSRANGSPEDLRSRYFNVDADITSLATAIARWLRENGRTTSPKFLIGESYGGFRVPLLIEKLRGEHGVGVSGATLLSPVLDFGWRGRAGFNPLSSIALLPSLAAAQLERSGEATRERLKEAEAYAAGEYAADLLSGVRSDDVLERRSRRVAEITGLDFALVRRLGGRLDLRTVQREMSRGDRRIVSAYDTGVSAFDPDPLAAQSRFEDPVLATMTPPLTSAMIDLLHGRLNWPVKDARYELLSSSVNSAWRWGDGRGQPESLSELRQALALDSTLRVLVVHGFTDLVTPYFESELLLRQIPRFGEANRVRLEVYPGGHMFYSRDASRKAFRADGAALVRDSLAARERAP
jgi:carboxypeptidase C (cathepsin A)